MGEYQVNAGQTPDRACVRAANRRNPDRLVRVHRRLDRARGSGAERRGYWQAAGAAGATVDPPTGSWATLTARQLPPKTFLTTDPRPNTTVTITAAMAATINPYSTADAPRSPAVLITLRK